MAKSPKSRKPAPRALFSAAALRTTALRVGFGVAAIGLGAGLYMLHGRRAEVVAVEARPVIATVAPAKPAAPESPPEPPPPPHREASAEAYKPMSPTLRAAFDTWLMATYARCWRAPKTLPDGDPYLPKVRVAFREDGDLAAPPKLVNPPSDPAWRPHAEAALKAVKGCATRSTFPTNTPNITRRGSRGRSISTRRGTRDKAAAHENHDRRPRPGACHGFGFVGLGRPRGKRPATSTSAPAANSNR